MIFETYLRRQHNMKENSNIKKLIISVNYVADFGVKGKQKKELLRVI